MAACGGLYFMFVGPPYENPGSSTGVLGKVMVYIAIYFEYSILKINLTEIKQIYK